MATKLLSIKQPITCLAFSGDSSQVAIGCADHSVQIFQFEASRRTWTKTHTLEKHTGRITGISWAASTGKIVTVSSDRNAYVWQFNGRTWEPELVLLRISRAATCVKWSPKEDKFAVGSAARLVTVCYWESGQKCWVSKHIKKPIKSTILSLDWHPNNYLLAAGSSDMTCRVFSTYIKDIEAKPQELSWGKKMPYAAILAEYPCNGWVSAVSFSPDGEQLAFASHDSTVQVAQGGNPQTMVSYGKNLPFIGLEWTSGDKFVGVGHDRCPYEFGVSAGGVQCLGKHSGKGAGARSGGVGNAMRSFQNMDLRSTANSQEVSTAHVSPISDIAITDGAKGQVASFATSGGDGLIHLWAWGKLGRELQQE